MFLLILFLKFETNIQSPKQQLQISERFFFQKSEKFLAIATNTGDIASRIRALPDMLGVSVAEFCERSQITTQSYSAYKRAASKPGADVLAQIITAWAVSPYWLLLGLGEWRATETIVSDSSMKYTIEDFNLVRLLDRIKEMELEITKLKHTNRMAGRPKPYSDTAPQGQAHEPEGEE